MLRYIPYASLLLTLTSRISPHSQSQSHLNIATPARNYNHLYSPSSNLSVPMNRLTSSRRPEEEDTQDARMGIMIQTDLEAQNAIAARNSTNRQFGTTTERDCQSSTDLQTRSTSNRQPPDTANPQSQISTPPQSFNDKFPLYLAKLDSLVSNTKPPPSSESSLAQKTT